MQGVAGYKQNQLMSSVEIATFKNSTSITFYYGLHSTLSACDMEFGPGLSLSDKTYLMENIQRSIYLLMTKRSNILHLPLIHILMCIFTTRLAKLIKTQITFNLGNNNKIFEIIPEDIH